MLQAFTMSFFLLIVTLQSFYDDVVATSNISQLDQALQDTLSRLKDKKSNKNMINYYTDPIIYDENLLYENELKRQNIQNAPKRNKRATIQHSNSYSSQSKEHHQLVDACQSKLEVLTPYYATNSKGKLRVVVNSELMQQAIQVETCVR